MHDTEQQQNYPQLITLACTCASVAFSPTFLQALLPRSFDANVFILKGFPYYFKYTCILTHSKTLLNQLEVGFKFQNRRDAWGGRSCSPLGIYLSAS